jgi:L-lactate dehydrogenase (cytochrome)
VVGRRAPKSATWHLLKFKKPSLKFKETRLTKAQTIYDLRRIGRRRTPRGAFD